MSQVRVVRLVERAYTNLFLRNAEAMDATQQGNASTSMRRQKVSAAVSLFNRRDFLTAGASSLTTALLAACGSHGPDEAEKILRFAERQNEVVERWLLRHTAMNHAQGHNAGNAFPMYFISKTVPTWDTATRGPWTLEVSGLVDRPMRFTLEDLVKLPSRRQRVDHFCVEGWNAVAEWWGVRVSELARVVGARADAKYVDFRSFDSDFHESWDLESATHPQTIVAYAKDGKFLPAGYGAPARLHSPIKLGYKNTKYLTSVVFMEKRNGGYWSDQGYEWYGGT
ncbi:MAG: molybdopterin-dependent oxidoreductase [Gemmatimonadota bacterium]|nr:molybdopterin-dependent oxidoreductase [Gemmatimonadota bacterium]